MVMLDSVPWTVNDRKVGYRPIGLGIMENWQLSICCWYSFRKSKIIIPSVCALIFLSAVASAKHSTCESPQKLIISGDQDVIFFCPNHCGRTYTVKGSLSRHLKYECGTSKKFNCEFCRRQFCHKADLKKHVGLVHKTIML